MRDVTGTFYRTPTPQEPVYLLHACMWHMSCTDSGHVEIGWEQPLLSARQPWQAVCCPRTSRQHWPFPCLSSAHNSTYGARLCLYIRARHQVAGCTALPLCLLGHGSVASQACRFACPHGVTAVCGSMPLNVVGTFQGLPGPIRWSKQSLHTLTWWAYVGAPAAAAACG